MLQLDSPWWLLLLPLPWLALHWLPAYREGRTSVRVPFTAEFSTQLAGARNPGAEPGQRLQRLTHWLVWLLLLFAAARPVELAPPLVIQQPTRDLVLAIDLSESMATRDYQDPDGERTDRLSAVKAVVNEFIQQRHDERIGLVVFGNAAFPQAPPTRDHDTVQRLLVETAVGMAGPNTAVGDAIGVSLRLLEASDASDKVLILLTDGHDTASRMAPTQAAAIAARQRLTIHTIAVGDTEAEGSDRVDLATLQEVARITNGQFLKAGDSDTLAQVYRQLDALTPHQSRTLSYQPRTDLFWLPLGLALALLLSVAVAGLIRARCERRSADRTRLP